MLMFVLGAFNAGVKAQFAENFAQVAGIVEITQTNRQGWQSNLPVGTIDKLKASEIGNEIESYNAIYELSGDYVIPYLDKLTLAGNRIAIIGVNRTLDSAWDGPTANIRNGRLFNPGEKEVIIDSRLANVSQFDVSLNSIFSLYLNGTPFGDTLNVTIVGIYNQEDSGAPSFVPRTYYMYMDIELAWDIAARSGVNTPAYTKISLLFPSTNSNQTQGYVQKINELSEQNYFGLAITAFSLTSFQGALEQTFSILDSFILVISLVTALAGGMGIIVSQLMSVMERMKEFAILKATGWKNSHVFQNVIFESLTLGILGAIIGMGLGTTLILVLGSGGGFFGNAQAKVTIELVVQVLSFAFGIGVLGGIYPAFKAARVRPAVVVKGE
jgi:putative ABC transport system permease protein